MVQLFCLTILRRSAYKSELSTV